MPIDENSVETLIWSGTFWGAVPGPAAWIRRSTVKLHLCGTARAKDSHVNTAVMDRFEPCGGGSRPAIGTKAQPGPLYGISQGGISKHVFPALAVVITYLDQQGIEAPALRSLS